MPIHLSIQPWAFCRKWALTLSLLSGVLFYFAWTSTAFGKAHLGELVATLRALQPMFIFAMLFITFCKLNLRNLRLRPWHGKHLLFQSLLFGLGFGGLCWTTDPFLQLLAQAWMLCFIAPPAGASAVVVGRLGGKVEELMTYLVLANILAAVLLSLLLAWLHETPEYNFVQIFVQIMIKLFSMLVVPIVLATFVKRFFPRWQAWIAERQNLAFYLWTVCVCTAITLSTQSLMAAQLSLFGFCAIALVAAVACVLQFVWGRKIGGSCPRQHITTSQALGQKNTMFIIWAAHCFFTPVASVAGGVYTIYHNLWNSYQLAHKNKRKF